jgi:quinol-cytochrome oxidoreductase complex cytochrome b subunit
LQLIQRWFAERVPISGEQLRELTNEPVPNHLKSWWFCLGGTPAYLFVIQIFTGILLAFYYQASSTTAYESVEYITNDVAFGWYIRSMHKWAATLMIAAVILHQIRVYFTGAYRRPRELNWVIGMALLGCTLLCGFTGYSLVFEQLSYWAATVGSRIAEATPVIGPLAKVMLLGGDEYNEHTLSRFYILHAAILPGTIIVLLMIHIAFIRLHGVTELRFEDEPDTSAPQTFHFFPDHVLTELGIGLALMIVLSALCTLVPAHMGPKADPQTTPEVIKPEWFFYVSFRWLKMFSLTVAVLSTGLIVAAMFLWPWIDRVLQKVTGMKEISVYVGIVATCLLIGLTVYEAVAPHHGETEQDQAEVAAEDHPA